MIQCAIHSGRVIMLDRAENSLKIAISGFHLFENHKMIEEITAGNWKKGVDQLIFSAEMMVKGTVTSVIYS